MSCKGIDYLINGVEVTEYSFIKKINLGLTFHYTIK